MDGTDCRRCGARNAPDAEFCWQCYTPFAGGRRVAAAAVGPAAPLALGPARPRPSSSGIPLRPIAWTVALVVAVAGGWLAWTAMSGGFDFPASVGGFERIESDEAQQVQEMLDAVGGIADMEMEAAFYGAGGQPVYAVMAVDPPEGMPDDELVSSLGGGTAPDPAGMRCLPFADVGSACVWAADERFMAVQGYGVAVEQLQPVAEGVRAETA
ncbi:MAG TPA: hypothetical protein VHL78_07335 [Actinomycetota bacterium]|nr:hypothetical protein [Actinomycetota bacterium]